MGNGFEGIVHAECWGGQKLLEVLQEANDANVLRAHSRRNALITPGPTNKPRGGTYATLRHVVVGLVGCRCHDDFMQISTSGSCSLTPLLYGVSHLFSTLLALFVSAKCTDGKGWSLGVFIQPSLLFTSPSSIRCCRRAVREK